MSTTKTWHVDIYLGEREGRTHAEARLHPGGPGTAITLTGNGDARLNPTDRDIPEIGDELAVARALSDLSHRLLHAAAEDIEGITHEPVGHLQT